MPQGGASLAVVGFARDPRHEPKAGDVLERFTRAGAIQYRKVVRVFHSPFAKQQFVVYATGAGHHFSVALAGWKSWSKDAHLREVAR